MKWLHLILIGMFCSIACTKKQVEPLPIGEEEVLEEQDTTEAALLYEVIGHPISLGQYFQFLDSVINKYDTLLNYKMDEHILIQTNDWVIDRLQNTDYYRSTAQGEFVYDNRLLPILNFGDTLFIPDSLMTLQLCDDRDQTVIDVNIPEYKLRIKERGIVKHSMQVRVGRNERKYLALAGREVDLRTATGVGYIYRIERDPIFINPSNGKRYYTTKRDDGQRTRMPQIPWLEPILDDIRYGHLIHPTSNPKTLGKAYSNGCIGLGEADSWLLYYHAPVGTKVVFRYDVEVLDEKQDTVRLRNIYRRKTSKR
ncbi:MAG: L,D-transpeptidase [Saprospiraceae bacterium]|nr:L,D-transpeptidase [Saprospiraceae bacterium]